MYSHREKTQRRVIVVADIVVSVLAGLFYYLQEKKKTLPAATRLDQLKGCCDDFCCKCKAAAT